MQSLLRRRRTTMACVALVLICLTGCDAMISHREVSRTLSPSGQIEAIVDEVNGGATSSFAYSIYLVAKGSDKLPPSDHAVFRADHVEKLKVSWINPRLMEITYHRARIFQFTNSWGNTAVLKTTADATAIKNYVSEVEIRLTPLSPEDKLVQ